MFTNTTQGLIFTTQGTVNRSRTKHLRGRGPGIIFVERQRVKLFDNRMVRGFGLQAGSKIWVPNIRAKMGFHGMASSGQASEGESCYYRKGGIFARKSGGDRRG